MPSYSGIFTLQAQMQAVAANNWTGVVPTIGSAYQGGYFAGQVSTAGNGIADYNLVVGPVASAENTSIQFKTTNTNDAGAGSLIDGPANSASMNDASHPAAQFCEALTIGGFTDWYMPARLELDIYYFNLKPTTNANVTTTGVNAYAVPARASNYTSGTPAQTSAAIFKDTGAEDYSIVGLYWSSTQTDAVNGWSRYFLNGNQYYVNKNSSRKVRAVRRVPV